MKRTFTSHTAAIAALLLAAGALTASCISEVDLSHLDQSPRLVVYCMPTEGDTTYVQVNMSDPLANPSATVFSGSVMKPTTLPRLTYRLNGVEQTVERVDAKDQWNPKGYYRIVASQKAGDRVELTAELDGYATATAETVVPQPMWVEGISGTEVERLDEDDTPTSYYQLTTRITDLSPGHDYYAVQVLQTHEKWFYNEWGEYVAMTVEDAVEIDDSDEPLLSTLTKLDEQFGFSKYFIDNFYVFDDRRLPPPGTPYTLRLNVTGHEYGSGIFRVAVYRLTPEFYQFVKSIDDAWNSGLVEYGLATVASSFTNVKGGLGLVGGFAAAYTPFIDRYEGLDDTLYTDNGHNE